MKKQCPLIHKPCIKERCEFWTRIQGNDPQTGQHLELYDCSLKWLPALLVQNAKELHGNASAIESFRNEMVRQNDQSLQLQQREQELRRLT